jgi:hypothetical protein
MTVVLVIPSLQYKDRCNEQCVYCTRLYCTRLCRRFGRMLCSGLHSPRACSYCIPRTIGYSQGGTRWQCGVTSLSLFFFAFPSETFSHTVRRKMETSGAVLWRAFNTRNGSRCDGVASVLPVSLTIHSKERARCCRASFGTVSSRHDTYDLTNENNRRPKMERERERRGAVWQGSKV